MANSPALDGVYLRSDSPNWAPLEAFLGPDLCPWFMWMHAIALEDGREVHAYKHCATRCYFHLALDGSPFRYELGAYVPITAEAAIADAFEGWDGLADAPSPADLAALDALYARVSAADAA